MRALILLISLLDIWSAIVLDNTLSAWSQRRKVTDKMAVLALASSSNDNIANINILASCLRLNKQSWCHWLRMSNKWLWWDVDKRTRIYWRNHFWHHHKLLMDAFASHEPTLAFEPRPDIFNWRNQTGSGGDLCFKVGSGWGALGWHIVMTINGILGGRLWYTFLL